MSLTGDINDLLNPIIALVERELRIQWRDQLVSTYIRGDFEVVTWGQTQQGIPVAYEGPPIVEAIDYADKRTASLVTRINEETRQRLRHTIRQGIEQKRGIDGLARSIRTTFADMTAHRSRVIARTETADALQAAFMDRSRQMGVEGKQWVVIDPCPICQPNEDVGIIPLEDEFPSGHDRPPAHPNCRCALAPALMGGR